MTKQNVLLLAVLYGSALSTLATGSTTNQQSRSHYWNTVRATNASPLIPKTIRQSSPSMILNVRGGSTTAETDQDTTSTSASTSDAIDVNDLGKVEDTEEEEENGNDNEGVQQDKSATVSSQPARLLIQTNWGNSVVDQRVEITTRRTNNIAGLKKQVSRLLPGRPPVLGLELVYGGKVLDDEMLVDELFDDDEDEEEELEEGDDAASKVLTLNSVPPVDPKFAIELAPKLKSHIEDDEDTLTTEELIEAFFLNQAAMSRNALLLAQPNVPSSPLLRVEIQEQAKQLKDKLKAQVPADVWEASLTAIKRDHNTAEIRGQRYRSGKGGARTSLKKSIQTNFNIDWAETIYNSLLLLFFGFFGGRNTISRTLMLWGAPLCFILQARPVKMWSKILFYLMANPPGIISSLLPAPQQAILNADMEKSFAALYRPTEVTGGTVVPTRASSQRKTVERETVPNRGEKTEEERQPENDMDESEEVDESEEDEEDNDTEEDE